MISDTDYAAGEAAVLLSRGQKRAGDAELAYCLKGKLYKSRSGWLLLSVPNAVGRGAFDAMSEPGVELPVNELDGQYNAHISVMRPEELETIPGGADAVTERGHEFAYTLGPVESVTPAGWDGVSKCWFIQVRSPDLQKLRKSYGLSGLPNNGQFNFHITFAVRKKKVLQHNDVSKAASFIHQPQLWQQQHKLASPSRDPSYSPEHPEECCPSCGARLERGDNGNCNRCGKPWPEKSASTVTLLREAKQQSDRGNYGRKLQILRTLISAKPADFATTTTPAGPMLGVVHKPTNFQMHAPRQAIISLMQEAR